jgi:hypothetical protein
VKKHRPSFFSQSDIAREIIEEDRQSEELSSEFSEYELSNGTTVGIRTIINQINKTKLYTQDGEPIYSVITTPVIKFKGKK